MDHWKIQIRVGKARLTTFHLLKPSDMSPGSKRQLAGLTGPLIEPLEAARRFSEPKQPQSRTYLKFCILSPIEQTGPGLLAILANHLKMRDTRVFKHRNRYHRTIFYCRKVQHHASTFALNEHLCELETGRQR